MPEAVADEDGGGEGGFVRDPLSCLPLEDWAAASSGGDASLARMLLACARRFLLRHGCAHFDVAEQGWISSVRIFRAMAAIRDDGTVRSAELFRTRDPAAFHVDTRERAASLDEAAWDDRASVFSHLLPPRRTRDVPTVLDYDGTACLAVLPDMVRQFEFLLNADLQRAPAAADIVLAPGPRTSHRPMRPAIRAAFAVALGLIVAREAPLALAAFRARLDGNRLATLGRAGSNGVRAYNWLCGLDRGSCHPASARRRLQAASAYPLAWTLIAGTTGPAAEAVEAERPLAQALASQLGVAESAVRRLASLDAEAAGLAAAPDAAGMVRLAASVARMPPGASPRTPDGWRAFFGALSLADALDRIRQGMPPCGPGLLASAAGKWDGLDARALAQAARGIGDMAHDFHVNAMWPTARHHGVPGWTEARSLDAIIGGRTLSQLAEASAWWHGEQAVIRESLGNLHPFPGRGVSGAKSWPPLHKGGEPWRCANGLIVVPLLDERALVVEHERLGHCVNQYAANCLVGGSHILSVRVADGSKSLGTVEFRQDEIIRLAGKLSEPPDVPVMTLPPGSTQFMREGNDPPRLEAWVALWDYAAALLTGALEVDAKALVAALEIRIASAGTGSVASCYDTSNPAAAADGWFAYLPLLPKSVARRGPAALLGTNPIPWGRQRGAAVDATIAAAA